MKRLRIVFLGAILAVVSLTLSSCVQRITAVSYVNEKDASQTLEMSPAMGTVKRWVVKTFHNTESPGSYALHKSEGTTKGRYTKDDRTYKLEAEGGKEWKLTMQPDFSLRDENGVIWRQQTTTSELRPSLEAVKN